MNNLKDNVNYYAEQYKKIKADKDYASKILMSENAYALENNDILAMPRAAGESRYMYLRNGLNFCVYSTGYISANEGLFSTFLLKAEGDEPRTAFFAGIPSKSNKDEYDVISLFEVPDLRMNPDLKYTRYTVLTSSCVYYITELENLRFTVRVFASYEKEIYFSILVQNLTDKPVDFFISSYLNPFLRHNINEDVENRFYRIANYYEPSAEQDEMGSFLFTVSEHISRTLMLDNYAVLNRKCSIGANSKIISRQITTSRYGYVGKSFGSLHNPRPLYRGNIGKEQKTCSVTQIAIAADMLKVRLGANEDLINEMRINTTTDKSVTEKLITDVLSSSEIDKLLEGVSVIDIDKNKNMKITFGLERFSANAEFAKIKAGTFNTFMEHVKRQVEVHSLHTGYLQARERSLIGTRDTYQSLEALLYYQSKAAREGIISGLGFIDTSGRCPRQYSLPVGDAAPIMDLRPFIDQGVWIITAMVAYLKFTGDFSILDEVCGYYDVVDEEKRLVKKSDKTDTVLDHLFRIMEYLEKARDHENTKCLRILYGDWNDALDGLGVTTDPDKKYGSGVSVMATLQYYQNLIDMAELLKTLDGLKYKNIIDNYYQYSEEIKNGLFRNAIEETAAGEKRILHGWGDKQSYYVGSSKDPDGKDRVGVTANSFWIISKMYDNDINLKPDLIRTFKRLDSKYGMKTFDKPFDPGTPGVGRIDRLAAGTFENAAPYVHSTCFAIWALFRIGECKLAWEQIEKILPFTHDYINKSPYLMPNSYFLNDVLGLDGESNMDWATGSANTLMKTLIRYVFGLNPEYNGFFISPAKELPFESFNFEIMIGKCLTQIIYKTTGNIPGNTAGKRKFTVNGKNAEGSADPISGIERIWLDRSVFDTDNVIIEITDA